MKKQALLTAVSLVAPMIMGSAGVFADTSTPTSASTNVNATFATPETDTNNPTPNNPSTGVDPDQPDDNTNLPLNPSANFALAYVPNNLNFGTINLPAQGSVEQAITLTNNKTLNVGVKDTQHNKAGWTLNAKLTGDLATAGAKITTTTTAAKVYDKDGALQPLATPSMITVTQGAQIGSVDQLIMQGNQGNVFSGTYDLDLGTVKLSIPDVSKVDVSQSSGLITWNLSQTPTSN
ncbi:WxL domain-containing protein (plasmid) [Enterococcus hirae]|uniref:WxL domain-containing protein n=1 Tax=Enterococcus hirae TaxID=1354 RepID=UPI0019E4B040|nr:WxL domain-containing protein [Enterococcus hirae]